LRLDYERNHAFFICKTDTDVRMTFEEGVEISFKCTKCGNQFERSENGEMISVLEMKIGQLEAELSR
jgi:transcription initiation factor IIE alpha subunit